MAKVALPKDAENCKWYVLAFGAFTNRVVAELATGPEQTVRKRFNPKGEPQSAWLLPLAGIRALIREVANPEFEFDIWYEKPDGRLVCVHTDKTSVEGSPSAKTGLGVLKDGLGRPVNWPKKKR